MDVLVQRQRGVDPSPNVELQLAAGPGGFVRGFLFLLSGGRALLGDPALRKLAAIPLVITTIVYVVLGGLSVVYADELLALAWAKPDNWLVSLWYVTWAASVVAALLVLMLLFATIVEAVGGPFYDKLAEKILAQHGIATSDPGLIAGTLPDLMRSIAFLIPAAICSAIGLIPVIGVPFAILGAAIAWFSLGLSSLNPALLVTGKNLRARLRFARRSLGTTMGLGAGVALSLLVPLLGIVSIPAAIVGATQLYAEAAKT